MLRLVRRWLTIVSCFALLLPQSCLAIEISADQLIKNPKKFDRQRVTVRGIADDGGTRLLIYADYNAKKRNDLKRMFVAYVDPKLGPYPGTNFGHYADTNARPVKVTGIIDARLKGMFGFDPFGMQLERVQVLGPRIHEVLIPLAYFRNDSKRKVEVNGSYGDQGFSVEIDPGKHDETGVDKHLLVRILIAKREIARFGPMTDEQWHRYFDPKKRSFYFRITNNAIQLVAPKAARTWKWYPDPERD